MEEKRKITDCFSLKNKKSKNEQHISKILFDPSESKSFGALFSAVGTAPGPLVGPSKGGRHATLGASASTHHGPATAHRTATAHGATPAHETHGASTAHGATAGPERTKTIAHPAAIYH